MNLAKKKVRAEVTKILPGSPDLNSSERVYKAVEARIRLMVAKMNGADPSRRKLIVESSADGLITISPRIENLSNLGSSK